MTRLILLATLAVTTTAPLHAIPAFARKYRTTCALCHDPIPKLNSFGQAFAARGFRLSEGDTTGASTLGDPLLLLQNTFPLAVRFDAYVRAMGGQRVGTDFGTPWVMKLLSGGPLGDNMTYYFYLLLSEDGLTGPIEDAWVMFNRPLGLPADLTVGQFQIADPVWKREVRITLENYQILSHRLGESAARLNYDRGLLVSGEPWGGSLLSAMLVNGNGIGAAEGGTFDNDGLKTGAMWLTQELGTLRISALGYYGNQRLVPTGQSATVRNRTWMIGPAATLDLGSVELNGQYIHREDSDPLFTGTRVNAATRGGFFEAHWWPRGRGTRALVTTLYNHIDSRVAGGDYETATLNLSWLHRRNVRLSAEATWDLIADEPRIAFGLVTAF
jgi:hypothetical protein